MPASDQHSAYTSNRDKWQIVRDCVEGSMAIKESHKSTSNNIDTGLYNIAGSRYLPPPNPSDNSKENLDRYQSYKTRANFVNFTGHTKDGLMGMVTRKEPEITLDPMLEYMDDNVDGAGQTLQQLIQRTIGEVMETGRYGLLTDYPVAEEGQTLAQTVDMLATIKRYPTESIINWRETIVGSNKVLSMVVLAEETEIIQPDGFSTECETWHRVLILDEGIYKQRLYNKDDVFVYEVIPRKFDGTYWTYLPFQFIGSVDNDPTPDKATLYDIAEINIAHYRNSADFEESSFVVGQPTVVLTGLTQAWADTVLKGGIQIGSRTAILLPSESNAMLLQANGNQMPTMGMEAKEKQMVKIGAKIITDSSGAETAEAAKIRFAGQNSKLGIVASNTEEGIEKVLNWASEYMGGAGENEIEINKQFYDATTNPQMLMAKMQLLDRGVIAMSDFRDSMRKSGDLSTDRKDEDIDDEMMGMNPLA